MTNENMHNNPERTLTNKLEEANEKLELTQTLVDIGAISQTEQIPDEVFARASEIAASSYVDTPAMAQRIAGIEFLFTRVAGTSELTETASYIHEYLQDIVLDMLSEDSSSEDVDSAEIVIKQTLAKVNQGEKFYDALLHSVAERKATIDELPSTKLHIENDGTVSIENPRLT